MSAKTFALNGFLAWFLFAAVSAPAQIPDAASTNTQAHEIELFTAATERIRADCIKGRRIICGRVLKVLRDGLVVDSGYTNLMRPPLDRSWLVPGTVETTRPSGLVEGNEPGCVCVGLVFLTDTPKSRRTKARAYDYVVIDAYPDGQYTYTSVGTIQRTVRRFSAALNAAVQFNCAAAGIQRPALAPGGK
jgi:hypothetical protein